jgi:hypothetical protein
MTWLLRPLLLVLVVLVGFFESCSMTRRDASPLLADVVIEERVSL